MGGTTSILRKDLKEQARIGTEYKKYIEPNLSVLQFFVEIAETGEGLTAGDNEEVISDEELERRHRDPDRAVIISTEVELISENKKAIDVVLNAIAHYDTLELAPEYDPVRNRILGCIPFKREMPSYAVVEEDQEENYRIAVLRLALRCLRIIVICEEVQNRMYALNVETSLNAAASNNLQDEYIRNDVRRIFRTIYGENRAVLRIAIAPMFQVIDVMTEYPTNNLVQLAGIKRLSALAHENNEGGDNAVITKEMGDKVRQSEIIPTICQRLMNARPSEYELFSAGARFLSSLAALDERTCKVIGQHSGVQVAVKMLKFSRGIGPEGKPDGLPSDFNDQREVNEMANLSLADVAQQALWLLDLLSVAEYNVLIMKNLHLKFILKEICLDPLGDESNLVVPRRLQLIDWDKIVPFVDPEEN